MKKKRIKWPNLKIKNPARSVSGLFFCKNYPVLYTDDRLYDTIRKQIDEEKSGGIYMKGSSSKMDKRFVYSVLLFIAIILIGAT